MRITPSWDLAADPPVHIAAGLDGPSRATITVEDFEGYDLKVTVALVGGRYECTELCVRQREGGQQITGQAIRSIPIAGIIRRGVHDLFIRVMENPPGGGGSEPLGWNVPPGLADGGPTDEALRWVTRVYRIAQALGQAPTQQVQEDLNLPRSTAGRWISLARQRGLLEPPPVKQYPGVSGEA